MMFFFKISCNKVINKAYLYLRLEINACKSNTNNYVLRTFEAETAQ